MFLRYYDERYYLDENRKEEIDYLLESQKIWQFGIEEERQTYATLINDYNSYIKKISKLINELDYGKDNLSKLCIITKLIHNGIFSYEQVFTRENDTSTILNSRLGLNIIDGSGCCRHISEFIWDVIPESRVITCVTECKNPLKNEANHMINLGEYNGEFYGFDAYNGGRILKFEDEFKIVPVDDTIKTYFNYKPYAEIIYYKRSLEEIREFLNYCKENKGVLSRKDELFIYFLTDKCLEIKTSKDMISDFRSDTRLELDNIEEQIKEIKIKRIYA